MTPPATDDAARAALEAELQRTPASMWDVSYAITTANEATICAIKALVQCLESAGALRPGVYVEALMGQTTGPNQAANNYLRTLMGIIGPANPPTTRSLN